MASQNGIIGDEDYGTNLPVSQVDNTQLNVEKGMARFSKTREFKKIKEHLESRIEFYQQYLPDGRDIRSGTMPTSTDWIVANTIINEFKMVLFSYENAQEVVDNANS